MSAIADGEEAGATEWYEANKVLILGWNNLEDLKL
jgi:hypothetical protein